MSVRGRLGHGRARGRHRRSARRGHGSARLDRVRERRALRHRGRRDGDRRRYVVGRRDPRTHARRRGRRRCAQRARGGLPRRCSRAQGVGGLEPMRHSARACRVDRRGQRLRLCGARDPNAGLRRDERDHMPDVRGPEDAPVQAGLRGALCTPPAVRGRSPPPLRLRDAAEPRDVRVLRAAPADRDMQRPRMRLRPPGNGPRAAQPRNLRLSLRRIAALGPISPP